MTLAAVVLDAENYSRSCASVLLHDGEKRDVSRLEASAPRARRARDDISRYVVVPVLHKKSLAPSNHLHSLAMLVQRDDLADE